jgi:hypothetical protein
MAAIIPRPRSKLISVAASRPDRNILQSAAVFQLDAALGADSRNSHQLAVCDSQISITTISSEQQPGQMLQILVPAGDSRYLHIQQ